MQKVNFRAEIFREGGVYIGLCRELNVSSFGETVEEARNSLQEAVGAFIEECEVMGTLEEVLEESGFVKEGSVWTPPKPIKEELLFVG